MYSRFTSTQEPNFVGRVAAGEYQSLSTVNTMIFDMTNFADMTSPSIKTPSIRCHGFDWYLQLQKYNDRGPKVAVSLGRLPQVSVKAYAIITCGDAPKTGKKDTYKFSKDDTEIYGKGCAKFMTQKVALRKAADNEGTLTFRVDLQVYENPFRLKSWKNDLLAHELYKRRNENDVFDVTFKIGSHRVNAHKAVLVDRAPKLYEDVENAPEYEAGVRTLDLPGVDEEVFSRFIEYQYQGEYTHPAGQLDSDPQGGWKQEQDMRKELLRLADRFGCVHLKFHLEDKIFKNDLNADTVPTLLLLAIDSKSALLKEAALKFYVSNADEVTNVQDAKDPRKTKVDPVPQEWKDWTTVKESTDLLAELLKVGVGVLGKRKTSTASTEEVLEDLDVASLRARLWEVRSQKAEFELGELDGTREELVSKLKEHINA